MERLLFLGLISNADDEGLGQGNPKRLSRIIFQYDDDLRASDVVKGLERLQDNGSIRLYTVDGFSYYQVVNFMKYQTINKPTPSKLPPPPSLPEDGQPEEEEPDREDAGDGTEQLPEDYGSTTVVLRDESGSATVAVTAKRKERNRNTPPTPPGDAPAAQEGGDEEQKKVRRKRPTYPEDSRYYRFALIFAKKVQENCTKAVRFPTEANLQHWADEIRLLVEVDKIPFEEALAAAKFVTTDDWWKQGRCTSCIGFRGKYTSIVTNERFSDARKGDSGSGYETIKPMG